jgi:hypothetical protein
MSIVIPPKARERLRASKVAADQLNTAVLRGRKTWTTDQEHQLHLIFQLIKETRDALGAIVDANP